VTTQPNGRIAAHRTTSDAAPLVPTVTIPTATPTTRPAEHVTTREIAEFLHHLTRFRSPALGGDRADYAALLARKAELLRRIADQHARAAPGPPSATAPTTSIPPEGRTP